MTLRFKFLSRLFDIVNVKLKPSLWRRKFEGPGVLTKAGLCCLRKRPQSETLCAFQSLGMKITAILFFEANTEDLVVQLATCTSLTDDRTKARDEQYLNEEHSIGGARPQKAAGVGFDSTGEILEVVDTGGLLMQVDSFGAHVLGTGVQSADLASGPLGDVLVLVTDTGGDLEQFDSTGFHLLGTGVESASVAFGPSGQVLAVVTPTSSGPPPPAVPEPGAFALAGGGVCGLFLLGRRS
jgi:PEP-CTERM motif-containing protein